MPRRALSTIAKQEYARRTLLSGFRRGPVLGGTINEKSITSKEHEPELAPKAKHKEEPKDKEKRKSTKSTDKKRQTKDELKDKEKRKSTKSTDKKSQSKDKNKTSSADKLAPQDTPKRKRGESFSDPQKKRHV